MKDVEDHDGGEGYCGIYLVLELYKGDKSKEDDEWAAGEVNKNNYHLKQSSFSVRLQLCIPLAVQLPEEVLLQRIYLYIADNVQNLLGDLHPLILSLEGSLIDLRYFLRDEEGESNHDDHRSHSGSK